VVENRPADHPRDPPTQQIVSSPFIPRQLQTHITYTDISNCIQLHKKQL